MTSKKFKESQAVTKQVWVTKYALSRGIYQAKVNHTPGDKLCLPEGAWFSIYWERECFEDKEAALQNARERAEKKAKSLRKQLAKIEQLAVTPKVEEK